MPQTILRVEDMGSRSASPLVAHVLQRRISLVLACSHDAHRLQLSEAKIVRWAVAEVLAGPAGRLAQSQSGFGGTDDIHPGNSAGTSA